MQVDFYVMENMGRMQALRELCLLLEKPYANGEPVFIHTATNEDAEQMDKLLWTYRDDSFLAHQIRSEANNQNSPIEIGGSCTTARPQEILVNLTNQIPESYQQFQRIIEIVYAEPAQQQASRERFRQYRELGATLNTHKMKVNQHD